jgi:hypothetical protein
VSSKTLNPNHPKKKTPNFGGKISQNPNPNFTPLILMQTAPYTAPNSHHLPLPWKSPGTHFTTRKVTPNKLLNRFKTLTFTNSLRTSLDYEPEEGIDNGPRPGLRPTSLGRLPVAIRRSGRVSRYFWDGNCLQLVRVDGGASLFSFDFDDGFRELFRIIGLAVRDFFIPKQVNGNYMYYVKWKFLHRVFSSALQVLATQVIE